MDVDGRGVAKGGEGGASPPIGGQLGKHFKIFTSWEENEPVGKKIQPVGKKYLLVGKNFISWEQILNSWEKIPTSWKKILTRR